MALYLVLAVQLLQVLQFAAALELLFSLLA